MMINMFNKQMLLFEKESTEILQYNIFNKTIKYDINAANNFSVKNNTLLLKQYNNSSVSYKFEKAYILRMRLETLDTFKLKVLDFNIFKNKQTNSTKRLELTLELLNEDIVAYYFLNQNNAEQINKKYFNED
ncbi:hypothetical protein [Pontimicrobium sp. MEBiC06410]